MFCPTPKDKRLDSELYAKLSRMRNLKPEHLDLNPKIVDSTYWPIAIDGLNLRKIIALIISPELKSMKFYRTPRDKLICICNSCKLVMNILHELNPGKLTSADAFLPAIIFLVAKANPSKLHSNLKYFV